MARSRRQAKPKPEAVILPPEFDEDDDETVGGGGIPDDDGWIHLEGRDGCSGKGDGNPSDGTAGAEGGRLVSRPAKRRTKRAQ